MKPEKTPKAESGRSPFAGCAIFIAALLVMVFLIVFSVVTLFRQFNEIAKFTVEKPATVEVSAVVNREAELKSLTERIESFRQQLTGAKEASLALTADEMNLAIAAYEPFKDLRGTFRILSVDQDSMRIAISFPLNGKPRLTRKGESGWIASDSRYLNGTLVAKPALNKHEVMLRLDDLEVPGAKVPREFIEQMSPYRLTERYVADPLIGPSMKALTRVGIAGGKVVFTLVPGETPSDVIGKEQVDSATSRFFTILGLAACGFLVIAGLILFVGLRAKGRG